MNRIIRITYFKVLAFIIFFLYFSGCCLKTNGSFQKAFERGTSVPVDEVSYPLIKTDIDLSKVVLTPKDTTGLFPPSYSISQKIETEEMKGMVVTYQTHSIPHTLAFAKGYSTRIEIYNNTGAAQGAYGKEILRENGTPVTLGQIGEESQAKVGPIDTPEGFTVPGKKYSLIFRHRNVLVFIIIKTDGALSPQRLESLGTLISDRLSATYP